MLRKVPDILIGTPGRMIEQLNAGNLDLNEVEVLVLDEADRMLDMGFADDVQRLVDECTEPSANHAVLRHYRRFGPARDGRQGAEQP